MGSSPQPLFKEYGRHNGYSIRYLLLFFFFFLYHASHAVVLNCAPAECVIYLWDADSHKGTHTHTRRSGFLWLPVKKINHSTTLQCSNTTAYYSKKWGTIFMLASKGAWEQLPDLIICCVFVGTWRRLSILNIKAKIMTLLWSLSALSFLSACCLCVQRVTKNG